ncbi:hypothetical protein [Pseudomonas sp. SST3]|uniref:hypothetical protein n=1 Tax=Pseudomonas sp. SST3 TaxID=2267882 RepID=UPI000DFABEB9|nr:hypothetical protein [Pseudomonas sp. SST3]NKQ10645.1 hypothetical protein [Pseudomonas sp. SST3]
MLELPNLLKILKGNDYIDVSKTGEVVALGVTSESVLNHTADIFAKLAPDPIELGAIDLAERASIAPVRASEVRSEIADLRQLAAADVDQLFTEAGDIGFVESEQLDASETLLFNGNLFRRETSGKLMLVLDSLAAQERQLLADFTDLLKRKACIDVDTVKHMLGEGLFNKVSSIGLFDISIVNNNVSNTGFVTLPSAFSKFGSNSMVDDAFDLAKAFLSSVTYGITKSDYARGNIRMVDALLSALIRGEAVGPVSAIGQDYKVLELKGVVQVFHGEKNGRRGPMLLLLKREIGELARKAIREGDVSEHSLTVLPTASLVGYVGPEANRSVQRRKQLQNSPRATNDMLSALRTGVF